MDRCDCDKRIGECCPVCRKGEAMYRLRVKRHFDAAHHLPDHKGQCANVHGHRWEVEAEVSLKSVGDGGMVVDFADVKSEIDDAIKDLDHSNLNDLREFQIVPPTAENVATMLFSRLRNRMTGITAVTVWESPSASVTIEAP